MSDERRLLLRRPIMWHSFHLVSLCWGNDVWIFNMLQLLFYNTRVVSFHLLKHLFVAPCEYHHIWFYMSIYCFAHWSILLNRKHHLPLTPPPLCSECTAQNASIEFTYWQKVPQPSRQDENSVVINAPVTLDLKNNRMYGPKLFISGSTLLNASALLPSKII